jgi:hypothetical protein
MGVGDGGNEVNVVAGAGKEVVAGLVMVRDGCGVMNIGEGSNIGLPCGAHAVQRISMQGIISDFIFALM